MKWTAAILERFDHRLEWNYLGANPTFPFTDSILEKFGTSARWWSFSRNPALPLTEAFLDKYGENLNWELVKSCHEDRLGELSPKYRKKLEGLPDYFRGKYAPPPDQVGAFLKPEFKSGILPEPLRAALEYPLSHMSDAFLETYAAYLNWSEISQTEHLEWSIDFFEQFYRQLTYDVARNRFLYQTILAPGLNDALIERVCARLQPENLVPFYCLKPASLSEIGSVWSEHGPAEGDPSLYEAFNAWFERGDLEQPLPAVHFKLIARDTNPVHFNDVLVWRFEARYPVCVVSGRFKHILQQFALPLHRFFPVDIHIEDEFFGSECRTYYIFYVPEQGYLYYDYENTVFVEEREEKERRLSYDSLPPYHTTSYFTRQMAPRYPHPIRTSEEFVAAREELNQRDQLLQLRPQEYTWKAGFDLIGSDSPFMYYHIWVSDNLKKTIEATGLTGVRFERVWESRPRMLGLETPQHRSRVEQIHARLREEFENKPEPEQVTIRNFRAAQAWAESVPQNSGMVKKLFDGDPARYATDDIVLQKIRQKEVELDLLFPEWFIKMLQTGQLPQGLEDFSVKSPESLYQMSWRKDFPVSVKAVEFAESGGGGALFLALKKDSFYELDDAIYLIEYDQGPPPWLVVRVDGDGNLIGEIKGFVW
jgi:hypothetical protein